MAACTLFVKQEKGIDKVCGMPHPTNPHIDTQIARLWAECSTKMPIFFCCKVFYPVPDVISLTLVTRPCKLMHCCCS